MRASTTATRSTPNRPSPTACPASDAHPRPPLDDAPVDPKRPAKAVDRAAITPRRGLATHRYSSAVIEGDRCAHDARHALRVLRQRVADEARRGLFTLDSIRA